MNRWSKRILTLLFLIFWLVAISLPAFAFLLAARGQLQVGVPDNHVRVFLLQEADAEGIGVERTRPQQTTTTRCIETSVRYLMWAGAPENTTFCQCENADGELMSATNGRCPTP